MITQCAISCDLKTANLDLCLRYINIEATEIIMQLGIVRMWKCLHCYLE